MTAEQLKNSILQMAVQGKLVPQDPNDEPASELIKRIREEKEQLIKDGKIKKEKNPSYIFRGEDNIPYEKVGKNEPVSIADEVPFEIPESWEWVRLKDIILYDLGGGTPSKAEPSYWGGNIPWMSVKDFSNANNGFIEDTIDHITIDGIENSSTNVIDTDAIILCTRMGLGRTARLKRETAINQDLRAIWLSKNIDIDYFLDYYSTIRISGSGVTVKGIKKEDLFSYLFPLPPINEQRRISNQYKKILPPIQEYGNVQNSVDALKKAFPELLKKSILQEAVMGKLVPQDSNDEPASVLLEKIRAEKQRLITEGKLKKDKHESIIYRRDNSHYEKINEKEFCIDDEIPFEIPHNWSWVRLGGIVAYQNGYAFSKSDYSKHDKGIPVIKSNNLMTLHVKINNKTNYIESPTEKMLETQIHEKDLLMCLSSQSENTEPLGKTAIYNLGMPALLNQRVLKMTPYDLEIVDWLYYAINSEYFHYTVSHRSGGSAQSNLKLEHVLTMLVPIPPYAEQLRLIKAIEASFEKISTL